jgi:hypothetical protein
VLFGVTCPQFSGVLANCRGENVGNGAKPATRDTAHSVGRTRGAEMIGEEIDHVVAELRAEFAWIEFEQSRV